MNSKASEFIGRLAAKLGVPYNVAKNISLMTAAKILVVLHWDGK